MKLSFSEYYEAHKNDMKVYFSEYYEAHKNDMKDLLVSTMRLTK